MANASDRIPDLREFVKENDQRLFSFCSHMLHGVQQPEDLVLDAFREFGDAYRRMTGGRHASWSPLEPRVQLFQIAWRLVRESLVSTDPIWVAGRDTRQHKAFDEDLLRSWKKSKHADEQFVPAAIARLARVDLDFRAPVVLRDILGFDDEEVVRILGIRWGVYRHRLHRGRLECRDGLRGRPFTGESRTTTIPS